MNGTTPSRRTSIRQIARLFCDGPLAYAMGSEPVAQRQINTRLPAFALAALSKRSIANGTGRRFFKALKCPEALKEALRFLRSAVIPRRSDFATAAREIARNRRRSSTGSDRVRWPVPRDAHHGRDWPERQAEKAVSRTTPDAGPSGMESRHSVATEPGRNAPPGLSRRGRVRHYPQKPSRLGHGSPTRREPLNC